MQWDPLPAGFVAMSQSAPEATRTAQFQKGLYDPWKTRLGWNIFSSTSLQVYILNLNVYTRTSPKRVFHPWFCSYKPCLQAWPPKLSSKSGPITTHLSTTSGVQPFLSKKKTCKNYESATLVREQPPKNTLVISTFQIDLPRPILKKVDVMIWLVVLSRPKKNSEWRSWFIEGFWLYSGVII